MILVADKLERWVANHSDFDPERNYYGISNIYECIRSLWYKLHGMKGIISKWQKMRIREAYMQERDVITSLLLAGFEVETDPSKLAIITPIEHFKGHLDAKIKIAGIWNPLDIKVPDLENFQRIVANKKVPQKSYAQMQLYLNFSPDEGKRKVGIILVKNIETGQIWERSVEYQKEKAEFYLNNVVKPTLEIATRNDPPKLQQSLVHYECRMCQFRYLCEKEMEKK